MTNAHGTLTIDVNGYCNIACEFCYQDLDGSHLTREEIVGIVEGMPESRIVEIGGGEPLLHKEIQGIITDIRERGKKVHIATNATRIPEGFLDLEKRIREGTQIQVSLHASNPELYEQITGRNCFDQVIENTRLLQSRYATLMTSAIYKENLGDVPHLVELASDLSLPIRVNLVMPVGSGANVTLLTDKEVDRLRGQLLVHKLSGIQVESPLIHVNNCAAIQNAYGIEKRGLCPVDCAAKLYVSPRGEERNCEFLEVVHE